MDITIHIPDHLQDPIKSKHDPEQFIISAVQDAVGRESVEEWQLNETKKAIARADRGEAKRIPNEKVEAWLKSWGTENELDPPK